MKNKELIYLALAIGGAFLIHKYMMKSSSNISNPVAPGIPVPILMPSEGELLTQSSIKSMALNEIANSNIMQNAIDNVHAHNEYEVANTYQTLYGRSLSGVTRSCPTII